MDIPANTGVYFLAAALISFVLVLVWLFDASFYILIASFVAFSIGFVLCHNLLQNADYCFWLQHVFTRILSPGYESLNNIAVRMDDNNKEAAQTSTGPTKKQVNWALNGVKNGAPRLSLNSIARDELFADDLLYNQEENFCTFAPLKIFVTTFNVNGQSPPANLNDWLHIEKASPPDLIVVGLQEMDLALWSYVVDNVIKENEWMLTLQHNLPRIYRMVETTRLIGIYMIVFCRRGLPVVVSDSFVASIPTGFLNLGNKGGVGISLKLNDTLICFINSHLAAGGELNRRNQDFRLISQMRFNNGFGIFDHDAVIWLGDLNYRLDTPLGFDEVVRQIREHKFVQLFYFDQLKEQQRLRVAFNGFFEQQPSFSPTYKFDPGTHNWDSSEKKRIPAWCDRILYWTRDKNVRLEQSTYSSAENVLFSDHKPVLSHFILHAKKIDQVKRNAIYEQLLRELDKKQDELLPLITLSQTEFHFGTVHFDQPAIAVLSIKNTGQTPTHFNFRSANLDSDEHEKWLTITPQSSFLDVGATVEVTLQILVFNESVCNITTASETQLSSILILHLTGGVDYFIVVDARYKRDADLIVFD